MAYRACGMLPASLSAPSHWRGNAGLLTPPLANTVYPLPTYTATHTTTTKHTLRTRKHRIYLPPLLVLFRQRLPLRCPASPTMSWLIQSANAAHASVHRSELELPRSKPARAPASTPESLDNLTTHHCCNHDMFSAATCVAPQFSVMCMRAPAHCNNNW